jgi:tripartite ATP-independent transporter DctP family solute receptor
MEKNILGTLNYYEKECVMKKLMKSMLLVCFVSCFLLAGASGVSADPITLKMSATQPTIHPNYLALKHLEKLLNERVPGRFNISVHGGMSLGADLEVAQQVRAGLLQMATNTTANLSGISAPLAVCDLPFIFKDSAEADSVLKGTIGKELLATLPQYGMRGMCFIPAAFRQIFNSKRPIHSMKDIKGLKLRTAQSQLDIAAAKIMGAAPTPLNFAEVYGGIQQGVLEGVLIPALLGYGMRFHEVAKYLAIVDVQPFTLVWFVNDKWYEKLPADLKDIFTKAVLEARDWQMQKTVELDKGAADMLRAEGTQITVLSPEAKKPMIEAAQNIWPQFKDVIPVKWTEGIKKAKAAVK